MALTLIATPGDPAANSYATSAQADTLASYRIGAAAWASLSADQKVQTLVTAARDIDTVDFLGVRATTAQAMEWPRSGTAYDPAALPAPLVSANIELALSYASGVVAGTDPDVLNPTEPAAQAIKREKVGPLETEYFDRSIEGGVAGEVPYDPRGLSRFPSVVQRLLAPLVRKAALAFWGHTAIAVRAS